MATETREYNKDGLSHEGIGEEKLLPLQELGYNAIKDTEYLEDDKINFRLWLKMH